MSNDRTASASHSTSVAIRENLSTDQDLVGERAGKEDHTLRLDYEDALVKAVITADNQFRKAEREPPEEPQEFFDTCGPTYQTGIVRALRGVLADASARARPEVPDGVATLIRMHNRTENTRWKYLEAFLTQPEICGVTDATALKPEQLVPIGKVDDPKKSAKPSK